MKKLIGILALLVTATVWAEAGMYLEGITILGAKKSAYLVVDGGKVTVNEGEKVGKWQVVRIEERSVFLKTDKGETTELPLHSWLKPEADKNTAPKAEAAPVGPETFERVLIPDDQIPPGYRRVRTPFGDVLVKDDGTGDGQAKASDSQAKPADNPGKAADTPVKPNDSPAKPSDNPAKPSNSQAEEAPLTNLPAAPRDPSAAIKAINVPDDQVPPGYRKVQTPFGEYMLKEKTEESKPTQ